jgi:hypothetical protein
MTMPEEESSGGEELSTTDQSRENGRSTKHRTCGEKSMSVAEVGRQWHRNRSHEEC